MGGPTPVGTLPPRPDEARDDTQVRNGSPAVGEGTIGIVSWLRALARLPPGTAAGRGGDGRAERRRRTSRPTRFREAGRAHFAQRYSDRQRSALDKSGFTQALWKRQNFPGVPTAHLGALPAVNIPRSTGSWVRGCWGAARATATAQPAATRGQGWMEWARRFMGPHCLSHQSPGTCTLCDRGDDSTQQRENPPCGHCARRTGQRFR